MRSKNPLEKTAKNSPASAQNGADFLSNIAAEKIGKNAKNSAKTVFVGMSGGVDSSLSAALLQAQNYDVVGVYMKNWTEDLPGMKCPWAADLADAKRVAVQLGIPFRVFDFQTEYKHLVVDYMISEYEKGRTPNPDIMCNQEVKFGIFAETAFAAGADYIATGHYARKISDFGNRVVENSSARDSDQKSESLCASFSSSASSKSQNFCLARSLNENKDQTYFLYRMSRESLSRTIFPIGEYKSKADVRRDAAKFGLATAKKPDSQGICFVGEVGVREFLSNYIETEPGDIVERETGKMLGRHDGAIFYTLGQRHGLNVGGGLPFYVVGKNMTKNEVYVSKNLNSREFFRDKIELVDARWIGAAPEVGREYLARFRHRGRLTPCTISRGKDGEFFVATKEPSRAVAPGQSVVLYDGEICLGGGVVK